jgi:hypothetical protein
MQRESQKLWWAQVLLPKTQSAMKVTVDTMRKPAEPKPDFVECAIVELLRIAQCHGITPADVIQLLDSGMHISDFLAALTPLANSNDSIDCDSWH